MKKNNVHKKLVKGLKVCSSGQPSILSLFRKQSNRQLYGEPCESKSSSEVHHCLPSNCVVDESPMCGAINACSSDAGCSSTTNKERKSSRLSLKRKHKSGHENDDAISGNCNKGLSSVNLESLTNSVCDKSNGRTVDVHDQPPMAVELSTINELCHVICTKCVSNSHSEACDTHSSNNVTTSCYSEGGEHDKTTPGKCCCDSRQTISNITQIRSEADGLSKITDSECNNTEQEQPSNINIVKSEKHKDHEVGILHDDADTDVEHRVPYYLENFKLILDTVLGDEYYYSLFNSQDQLDIATFRSLSESSQKLYVRLIQRQLRWLRQQKIQYPDIVLDLTPILNELVNAGLLINASSITDLKDVLDASAAPDVKSLAKTLKLSVVTWQKDDIMAAILQHSRRGGIGAFFGGRDGNKATCNMIMKRAKIMLGACYKLKPECRNVFMRIMMLFGLHRTRGDDEDGPAGQQQIFQMLMTSVGRIKYPKFTVSRQSRVFKDRESFLRFAAALQLETDMSETLDAKRYDEATALYDRVLPVWSQWLQDLDSLQYDRSLSDYLRAYTAGAVYTRVMSQAVELLQYQRKYGEAVQLLEQLLRQDVYHMQYRGRWYDRIALNLDHHLKKHNKTLDVIKEALSDDCVRTGHRLSLYQRAFKLCHAASSNKYIKSRWVDFEGDMYSDVQEAPQELIQGRRLACGQQGPLYISNDGDDVTLLTRVEDVALAHYREQGYSEGIHGEGGTLTCLFALYMWDIIFLNGIPDTFYNPFQICPLDWGSDHFYRRRQQSIDDRLEEIRSASTETLEQMLESSWVEHEDTLCIGLSWDRFRDVDHAKGFVRCVGGEALSQILERFARNMRNCTGGVPDLALWNPNTGAFKMVEVKGPGDRLSTKQVLWLDYFLGIGLSAAVCYVQAISSKKLHKSS